MMIDDLQRARMGGSIGGEGGEIVLQELPGNHVGDILGHVPSARSGRQQEDDVPEGLPEYVEWAMERAGGGWGRFQRVYCTLLAYSWCVAALQTLVHIFLTLPAHRRRLCSSKGSGCSVELLSDQDCSVPPSEYEFVELENSVVAEFGLVCENAKRAPLLGTMFFLGYLGGAYYFGGVADRRGRRPAYLISSCVMECAALLAAVAPNYPLYAFTRLLTGVGVGGSGLVACVWATEFLGASSRSFSVVLFNCFFCLGGVSLSPLAFLLPHWRQLSFVLFLLGLPLLAMFPWLRESPKWLVGPVQNPEEAHKVITYVAQFNGQQMDIPPPAQQRGNANGSSQAASSQGITGILRILCLDARVSGRFRVMCIAWFALTIGYYGLAMNVSNLGGNVYIASALAFLVEVPTFPLALYLIDTAFFGRRGTVACGMLVGGTCCLLAALVAIAGGHGDEEDGGDSSPSVPLFVLAFTGKAGVALSFAVVYMYAVELFPTDIRTQSIGLQSVCARVAGMTAPVVASLGQISKALPLVIFGALVVVAGTFIFSLPETRGQQLPGSLDEVQSTSASTGCPLPCLRRYSHLDEEGGSRPNGTHAVGRCEEEEGRTNPAPTTIGSRI